MTTLSSPSVDPSTMFAAAAAAATVKQSWGWDESPSIVVRFASGPSITVDPVFDAEVWTVAVDDVPQCHNPTPTDHPK